MKNIVENFCKIHGMCDHIFNIKTNKYKCRLCNIDAVNAYRKRRKNILVEYKGGKCEKCGYNKCMEALEFHHLNANEKELAISSCYTTHSLEILKKEVDKCILLCSNCHKEIHCEENKIKEAKRKEIYAKKVKEYIDNSDFFDTYNHCKIKCLNINNIKEDIKNNLTQKQIAAKYQISISSLKRFLHMNQISMKQQKVNLTKEEFEHYMREHTIMDFLNEFSVSQQTFKKWEKRYK